MILITTNKKNLARRYFANVVDCFIIFVLTFLYIYFFDQRDDDSTYRANGFKALDVLCNSSDKF